MPQGKDRTKVRVESVSTKCGSTDHMTADEIRARSIGEEVDMACPECGDIHLTVEEACEAAQKKYSDTDRYKRIKTEAEPDKK
jgi:hypothetical protein